MRLNLCSGQRPFAKPWWTNVDAQERWAPDVVADCRSMPMFVDGSADLIVIHQGLEHLGCGEGKGMIEECYRILQPGGALIVSVPDMLKLAGMLVRGELSDQVYMTNIYGAYMGDKADRHAWGFTRRSLIAFLMACAPWSRAMDFDWRDIPGADIARDDRWILCVEVVK